MAIVTVRPDFQSSWTSQPHVRHLILPRLAPEESVALVRLIERADAPLPDNVVEKIIARSDGVPLFLEEVTRAVFEAADASNFDGAAGTQAQAMLDRIIPSTLHASLIGRLDHLGTAAKEVAQSGAAIGREFSYELLAAATEKSPSYLQDALTRLVEKGLIFQSGALPLATFLFKHALVQDAAYSTLLRGARRELHARIANALLAMNADDGVAPEMIALHLQNAELAAEAIVYWRKAGEQCVRRANNREAAAHFRRALSLLAARSPTNERWRAELAILSQLGPALMGTLGWNAAEVGEVVERATTVRRLVESSEEIAPSFQHYAAADLPTVTDRGFTARIIAGGSFGVKSPVTMVSPWFYTEVTAEPGISVPLDPDHEERAIYLIDGEVDISGDRYEGPRLLIFRPGDRITVKAIKPTRMMFLGGDALEGPRHIWWNFVSSSKERIEQAKQDWKTGRFAHVPNEHEFIPLPE